MDKTNKELSQKFEAYSILLNSLTDEILQQDSDFHMELDTVEKFSGILLTLQNAVNNIPLV